jgi:hypothetical protein
MNQPDHTAGGRPLGVADAWAALIGALGWTLAMVGLQPTPFAGVDFPRFFEPYAVFFRDCLLRGELPWWNPYASLGRPFLADLQSASFYPSTYLSVVFGVHGGWMLATVAHGMLALLGFTRLMRANGVTRLVAWGGGVVFLFSAPLLARMQAGQVNLVYGLCYLPLILSLAGQLAVQPSRRGWVGLTVTCALQLLCSHPQAFWLSAVGAGIYVTGLLSQPPWGAALRAWVRKLGGQALAGVGALALLGFVMVPFAELIGQSNRAVSSLGFSAKFAMTPGQWLSLVAVPDGFFPVNWEYNVRVGAVGLSGGLVALLQWRTPILRGAALMVLLGVVIAVGESTPLFASLYQALPGLASFRIPARAGVLVVLGLIMAASVLAGGSSAGRVGRGTVLLVSGGLAACGVYYYTQRMQESAAAGWLFGLLAWVAAALAGWWWWLGRDPEERSVRGRGLRLVLPAVVAAELCAAIWGFKHQPGFPAEFPVESVVVAAIRAHGLDRQVAPVRVCLPAELMRENSGMLHRYATLTGFESLSLGRVWGYLHRTVGADPNHPYNSTPDGRIYDQAARLGAFNLMVTLPAGSSVLAIAPAGDPRAYLATRITVVPDYPAAIARMIAGHPFHEDALVEQRDAAGLTVGPVTGPGTVTIQRFTLNSIDLAVDSPGDALLVVAEAWYPGWRASINGRSVACLPVNGWMRGVPVPAGQANVRLTYHQNGFAAGSILSLLTGLWLVWLWRSGMERAG